MKKLLIGLSIVALACSSSIFANGAQETKADDTKVDSIYVYNSKGENAEQFAAMCEAYEAETGIHVKNFSIGSGQDHMETLRAEMNSNEMPTIFSIQGMKELPEWEQGGFVQDLSKVTTGDFGKMAQAIPEGLRLSSDGMNSYGVPYNVEGYGYIADKAMLQEIFGTDPTADIQAASYDEWENLVTTMTAWIANPSAAKVTLNGMDYTLAAKKGALSSNLTGVFAVMGSEKWTYGDHFLNVAINSVFATSREAAAATDDDVAKLEGAFMAYAKALDLKTSNLAGADGPAQRGQDFVSSAKFGYDQAVQIFAQSKAMFLKQGNWAFGNIEGVNADMAARLEFLPVKMPFVAKDVMRTDKTVADLNSSIPVFVPNYYAVNALVSDAKKQAAYDFLYWLNNSETGKNFVINEFNFIPYNADPSTTTVPNSLGNSIISYIDSDNTLSAPYNGSPASWSGDTVGKFVMENYLTKLNWTTADYKTIADYAVSTWQKMN
jgi:raffinose/stachyose/melibiose transport system substrate-binding protein